MANHLTALIAALVLLALVSGCDDSDSAAPSLAVTLETSSVAAHWRDQQLALRATFIADAQKLLQAVDAFVADPNEAKKALAGDAWKQAHLSLAAYRLFISDADLERLDSWPIEPGFIDAVPGYPDSGLIMDSTLALDAASITGQHGITSSEEASLGLHPIAFMLFERQLADFTGDTEFNQRRLAYLGIITDVMRGDIERLNSAATLPEVAQASAEPGRYLANLFTTLRAHADRLFVEASRFPDGHGSSQDNQQAFLDRQVNTLATVSGQDSPLATLLISIDVDVASRYQQTLAMIVEALASEPMDEQTRSLLPLMFSALGHHLEDALVALSRAPQVAAETGPRANPQPPPAPDQDRVPP